MIQSVYSLFQSRPLGGFIMISVGLHAAYAAAVSANHQLKPSYTVQQASSSVEVYLLEQTVEEAPVIEEIMTVPEPVEESQQVEAEEIAEEEIEEKPDPVILPEKGAVIEEARVAYLTNPAPVYPWRAKQKKWQGTVILKVYVDKTGSVTKLMIEESSGYRILDESAFKTVEKWKFIPAKIGSLHFASTVQIPVRFQLT